MSNLYLLLYLPLAGLTVLWLLAALKLARNDRERSRGTLLRSAAVEAALALFIISLMVMVATHGRGFKTAMIINVVAALVNATKWMIPLKPRA